MKKFVYLLVLVTAFTGCGKKETQVKIPEEVLAEIMADLMLTDAIKNDHLSTELFGKLDKVDMHSWTWEQYGYTKADYDSTIKSYTDKPEKLNKLYQDVIYQLSVLEEEIPDQSKTDTLLISKKIDLEILNGVIPEGTKVIFPIDRVGRYTIRVEAQVDLKDRSESLGMRVSLDTTNLLVEKESYRDKERVYLKDGRSRSYQVSEVYRVNAPTNLTIDMAWSKDPESLKKANFVIKSYEIKARF